jgi:hypothetical protein
MVAQPGQPHSLAGVEPVTGGDDLDGMIAMWAGFVDRTIQGVCFWWQDGLLKADPVWARRGRTWQMTLHLEMPAIEPLIRAGTGIADLAEVKPIAEAVLRCLGQYGCPQEGWYLCSDTKQDGRGRLHVLLMGPTRTEQLDWELTDADLDLEDQEPGDGQEGGA